MAPPINTGPDPEERTEPMPLPHHALPLEEWRGVVETAEMIAAEQEPLPAPAEEDYEPGEDGF